MFINAASSFPLQRSMSEPCVFQSSTGLSANERFVNENDPLEYLDLARSSQQLTDKLWAALQQPAETEITAALNALNAILAAAEELSADPFDDLSPDNQHLYGEFAHYIFKNGSLVDSELCSKLRDIDCLNPTTVSNSEGCWARFKNVLTIASDGNLCRYLHNAKNICIRSVLCVALPTLLRQIVAYEVESLLVTTPNSQDMRFILAAFAGTLPLVLNLAGGVREYVQGTATVLSSLSRAFTICVSTAAMIAAASTGALAGLAPTLMSFQAYSFLREGAQSIFRINSHAPMQAASTLGAATLYFPNQVAVSLSMSAIASPSGSAAALQHARYLDILTNDLNRSALNTLGEAVDLTVYSGLSAMQSGIKLDNDLEVGLPDQKRATDAIFNALAARLALMNTPIMISSAIRTALAEYFDESTLAQIDDILCAGLLGCLYPSFVATFAAPAVKPDLSDA